MVGTLMESLELSVAKFKDDLLKHSSLKPDDIKSAISFLNKPEVNDDLLKLIIEDSEVIDLLIKVSDKVDTSHFADIFCPLFYLWTKHESKHSLMIISNFIPVMIYRFLSVMDEMEANNEVSTCLLQLVNVFTEKANFGFRMPSIHMASVYHHPARLQYPGGLTEASLSKGFNMEPIFNESGLQKFNEISASNRLQVLNLLIRKYSQDIQNMGVESIRRMCWLAVWYVASGTPDGFFDPPHKTGYRLSQHLHTVNPDILNTFLSCVLYGLYNGHSDLCQVALDVFHKRAAHEILPEVILTTRSMLDDLSLSTVNPAAQPFGIAMPKILGSINDRSVRAVRGSFIKSDDINLLRKRMSSSDMLPKRVSTNDVQIHEESPDDITSSPSPIIDVGDSDESDILIASFRGGKLQNSSKA